MGVGFSKNPKERKTLLCLKKKRQKDFYVLVAGQAIHLVFGSPSAMRSALLGFACRNKESPIVLVSSQHSTGNDWSRADASILCSDWPARAARRGEIKKLGGYEHRGKRHRGRRIGGRMVSGTASGPIVTHAPLRN
jgi:hypothetical protein